MCNKNKVFLIEIHSIVVHLLKIYKVFAWENCVGKKLIKFNCLNIHGYANNHDIFMHQMNETFFHIFETVILKWITVTYNSYYFKTLRLCSNGNELHYYLELDYNSNGF